MQCCLALCVSAQQGEGRGRVFKTSKECTVFRKDCTRMGKDCTTLEMDCTTVEKGWFETTMKGVGCCLPVE